MRRANLPQERVCLAVVCCVARGRRRGVILLLEVVVGMGLFLLAVLFIFGVFVTSQKATVSSKNLAIGSDLAKEVMETELARGYTDLVSSAPVNTPIETEVDGVLTTTTFTSEVSVTEIPPGTEPGVDDFGRKIVRVTISWPESTGQQRNTVLETLVVD